MPIEAIQLRQQTVLIIDDDPIVVDIMETVFDGDLRILTARNGRSGIAMACAENPDLILLDVRMPDMDGYETMRRIRAIEKFRDLPILALTAKAMKGDREKCIEAGASDYIAKPVDTEHLLSLMRIWLHR